MPRSPLRRVGVVGGGIVGLATARAILRRLPDLDVTVLEKEPSVGQHQTRHNSGVVHAGIYYTPGSLKATLCVAGVRMLKAFCEQHAIDYQECGKLIVATSEGEVPGLHTLFDNGTANGVPGLRLLGPQQMVEIEPFVTGVAAIHSPHTAIVDFALVAEALAKELEDAGGRVRTSTAVLRTEQRPGEVIVGTTQGDEPFDLLVVCAGLYADRIARMSGDRADPMIVPFRGQYFMLRPGRRHLVRGLIYPVPDPRYPFLGVHLTRRVDGEVLVGPNALLALAREGYRLSLVNREELIEILRWPGLRALARTHWKTGVSEILRTVSRRLFVREAQRFVPTLEPRDIVRGPAGVRAQALALDGSLVHDFRITQRGRIVNVRNAPSPAATSSLAIGERIAGAALERSPDAT